ncbi:MAG: hypothetical protein KDB00_24225, partial [Planctomycetales bacterium]|nr:hypothetical protein [Planctomycetales bacterium]
FPKTFSEQNSRGLRPIGSHLRYVPDFCDWNGRLVLATDETSIQGNRLAGQPQSNLWFGSYDDLKTWGPASGYGGPWIDDEVKAGQWSDPFLVAGFQRRMLHLAVGRIKRPSVVALRATDQQAITWMPDELAKLPRVTVNRGDWHKPGVGYSFDVDQDVTVFLAVDVRGQPKIDDAWKPTDLELRWGKDHRDQIYRRDFPAGTITVATNETEHTPGSFGMPHSAFVKPVGKSVRITPKSGAALTQPRSKSNDTAGPPVTFAIQIDTGGTNQWIDLTYVSVPDGEAKSVSLPDDMDAVWMRFKLDRDCVATAMLHQTSDYPNPSNSSSDDAPNAGMFAGLADVGDAEAIGGLVYAAKRNRNLRIITPDDRYFEFTKAQFDFKVDATDEKLKQLLQVEPEFSVDEASVVIQSQGKRYRLPKGDAAYDRPFASGWPRATREVESERELANIHGTFYELPLVTNDAPPAWNLMRPVSSHRKQITDYCSWNGLLVLCGVKQDASENDHLFCDPKLGVGLWLGGIDDLWKLGKPIGHGGPWKSTPVEAGIHSDAYLMRGYDRKSVSLSHLSSDPVTITLEIDIDGNGMWVPYKSFVIPAGTTTNHTFPLAFSAFWVRAFTDAATTATVQFEYQ